MNLFDTARRILVGQRVRYGLPPACGVGRARIGVRESHAGGGLEYARGRIRRRISHAGVRSRP